ncbi:MAG: UDP-N-acetylglucosamine 2-epimerase (non-hydrolyzing) [Solirubrobacterales bacterium]|nr:UDP-N-acetylglucosamine 2-epimerase (non-hydrolyzing) [Solirubrobacterales bacterium]
MKVLTVLGTRPEIIRLSRIVGKLDRLCDHVLVHTGQNYDRGLSDVFFEQLGVRAPDHHLGVEAASFGEQIGNIIAASERIMREERPDRLLVLGDTNSALSAIVAKRLGVPVFHMEAGNRCYDDRVPEEVNRRVIDHSSDVLLPYTERSRANLLREGIAGERVLVTGNPIHEVLRAHSAEIEASDVLERLGLQRGRYFLVTMHREENVDVEERLRALVGALRRLHRDYDAPVVCSVHPRTFKMMERYGVEAGDEGVVFAPPFGFFDFVALERAALCVLSDSGTVQEECCIFKVPNVTLRDVTERPETLEVGSNMLSGADEETIVRCVRTVLDGRAAWRVPAEYLVEDVTSTVARIVLGFRRSTP